MIQHRPTDLVPTDWWITGPALVVGVAYFAYVAIRWWRNRK